MSPDGGRGAALALILIPMLAWGGARSASAAPAEAADPLVFGIYGFRTAPGMSLPAVSGILAGGKLEPGRGDPAAAGAFPVTLRLDSETGQPSILFFFNAEMASSAQYLAGLESLRRGYGGELAVIAASPSPAGLVKSRIAGIAPGFPVLAASDYGKSLGLDGDFSWAIVAPGGWVIALREGRFDWRDEVGEELAALVVGRYGLRRDKAEPPR